MIIRRGCTGSPSFSRIPTAPDRSTSAFFFLPAAVLGDLFAGLCACAGEPLSSCEPVAGTSTGPLSSCALSSCSCVSAAFVMGACGPTGASVGSVFSALRLRLLDDAGVNGADTAGSVLAAVAGTAVLCSGEARLAGWRVAAAAVVAGLLVCGRVERRSSNLCTHSHLLRIPLKGGLREETRHAQQARRAWR